MMWRLRKRVEDSAWRTFWVQRQVLSITMGQAWPPQRREQWTWQALCLTLSISQRRGTAEILSMRPRVQRNAGCVGTKGAGASAGLGLGEGLAGASLRWEDVPTSCSVGAEGIAYANAPLGDPRQVAVVPDLDLGSKLQCGISQFCPVLLEVE